jgi:CRP-like cAMP-binding protein
MQELFRKISEQIAVSITVLTESQAHTGFVEVRKGDHWLREGESSTKVGFVISGIFRKYRTDDRGREFTTDLVNKEDFLAPYADLLQSRPTTLSIQALEDSRIAIFDFSKIRKLAETDFTWTQALLRVTEQLYIQKEWRESFFATQSASKRLAYFAETHPDLALKVPKQIVASFLGINASTLSHQLKSQRTARTDESQG